MLLVASTGIPARTERHVRAGNLYLEPASSMIRACFGNSYTIPVKLCLSGQALYYEVSFVFKNLLPADDLKYFSLAMASFLLGKDSQ